MRKVNVYHQKNIGENNPKSKCTLVATLTVENMTLRKDFHEVRDTKIEGHRETDEGDIIEIMPFENCKIYQIGQFEVDKKNNCYRRIH